MSERVIVDKADLVVIADAVRSVTGSTEPMTFSTLSAAVTNETSSYVKKYELVLDKTFTEEDAAGEIWFSEDSNGVAFDFEAVKIVLSIPGGLAAQSYQACPYCNGQWLLWNVMSYNGNSQTSDTRTVYGGVELKPDKYGDWEGWYTYEIAVPHAAISKYGNSGLLHKTTSDYPNITSIYWDCWDPATNEVCTPHPGTRLQIYAVRR